MIVSLKHGFAFLCTPKNASTSIEAVLKPYADIMIGGPPELKHLTAHGYRRFVLPLLDRKLPGHGVESFCLIREPLDWAASWYRYRTRRELKNPAHPNHDNYTGHLSFEAFVDALLADSPPPFARIDRQCQFMCDGDDRLLVDRLFRYEDLPYLCFWLSEKLHWPVSLPRTNVSPARAIELGPETEARFREAHALDYHLHERLAAP